MNPELIPWPHLEDWEIVTIEFDCSATCSCGKTDLKICTGFEGKGVCFWCGGPLPAGKRHRHYCCPQCSTEYHRHFFWPDARNWAIRRAGGKCQVCGSDGGWIEPVSRYGTGKSGLEVHHWLEAMNGEVRTVSVLNCPCNLIVLCHTCHWGPLFHGAKQSVKLSAWVAPPCPLFPDLPAARPLPPGERPTLFSPPF